ncbi:MAG: hypothetical protein HDS91_02170 [Bacteroidales bacterium]|nr:hypothetical protein [Bacteroidales bacterium]
MTLRLVFFYIGGIGIIRVIGAEMAIVAIIFILAMIVGAGGDQAKKFELSPSPTFSPELPGMWGR